MVLPQTDHWKIIGSPENFSSMYGKLMSDQNGILIEKKVLFSFWSIPCILFQQHLLGTNISHNPKY